MSILQTIILAIIEGLTEFLPVSSTGHLIIASSFFGIQSDDFVKFFNIAIQLGAILAVVALYWKKFTNFKRPEFYVKLAAAVVPALIFGKLFDDYIDELMEKPLPIGIALLVGGIILLFVDDWFRKPRIQQEEDIDTVTAIKIGLFQILAVCFPGTSRSAATIIGGMSQKLTKELATEFSFFLAVPTMFAATGYKILKAISDENMHHFFSGEHLTSLLIGNLVAFVVAILAIKFFIQLVSRNGFKWFGVYRIIAGLITIVLYYVGFFG
ncbi:MAG: undecaprenyl-diphosphate phosphatase [Bacteroidia bacterium]